MDPRNRIYLPGSRHIMTIMPKDYADTPSPAGTPQNCVMIVDFGLLLGQVSKETVRGHKFRTAPHNPKPPQINPEPRLLPFLSG